MTESKNRIYVAGHRGMVGSAIVRVLQQQDNCEIVTRTHAELDLTNQKAVQSFFEDENLDQVYLAAARVGGIHANDTYPAQFIRDNLLIQTNVIDSAYRNGVKKLLFLGSSCIYPRLAIQPIKEEYLLTGELESTNEWYAIAKIAGIKMCQAYRRQYGFNAISLMPTNLYGPGDNFDLENSHVLPALIRKFHLARLASVGDVDGILMDEQRYGLIPDDLLEIMGLARRGEVLVRTEMDPGMLLWGTGSPRREFLHVDDLAIASVYFMDGYDEEGILNIGAGKDLSISELAVLVQKTVGFEGSLTWDSSKPDGTPRKLLDVEASRRLGWQASIELEQGIRQVYQDYCCYEKNRRAS